MVPERGPDRRIPVALVYRRRANISRSISHLEESEEAGETNMDWG